MVGALSRSYDVGEWLSASHEPKGRSNVSFLIATTTGKYVLRQSNPRKSAEGMLFEVGLMEFLRQRGYPAPEVVAARHGAKFIEHGGALYLLSRFIPGGHYDAENPGHFREAGKMFGLYHKVIRHFPGPAYQRFAPVVPSLGPEGGRPFADIENFGKRFLEPGEQRRLSDLFSYVRGQSQYLHSRLNDVYPRLLKLVIQGSYGRTALIFDGDNIVGVVDYDRAAYELRALDLACSIKDFCSIHGKFRKERQVALDYGLCRKFLAAYQELEPLPGDELQVLPDIMRTRHVLTIIHRCNSFLLKAADAPRVEKQVRKLVQKLERESAWLEWLEKHEGELASALSAA
jgi:homoserine kinase type II